MTAGPRIQPGTPAKLPRSLAARHAALVVAAFAARPASPAPTPALADAEISHLPAPVRRYIAASGALGRPRVRNVRIAFDARMYRAPGAAPMQATSVQYNFFDTPTRLFLMKARMFGLPVRALHLYADAAATFTVRAAELVRIVDVRGPQISAAETVTVLNDLCAYAPGMLADSRLAWEPIDDRSAGVTFTNGPHRVRATLHFSVDDELVDFESDDRPDASTGTYRPARWSTPLSDYRDFGGMRLPARGQAVYALPAGPFTYGDFTLRSIDFDLAGPLDG